MGDESDLAAAARRLGIPLWGRIVLSFLLLIGGVLWRGYVRLNDTDIQLTKIRDSIQVLASKTPDKDLIKQLLTQAARETDARIENKLTPFEERLNRLDRSLKSSEDLRADLQARLARQEALNRLQDPGRILANIRAEIQVAQAGQTALPVAQLSDYRNAVKALPTSAFDYWTTVAAIVNYQSLLNQMSGAAPDPAKVARPCFGTTNEGVNISGGNAFIGVAISRCFVDLDTNGFSDLIFKDCVVRYRGESLILRNVAFINCRFIIDIPSRRKLSPAESRLLMTILDSVDQRTVKIPRG
jgi:hypothetical protein